MAPPNLTPVVTAPGIHQYRAIPYASIPHRFAAPVLIPGIVSSSPEHGPLCPQIPYDFTPLFRTSRRWAQPSDFSELDCLTLTITAPAVLPTQPLPVLINIPGGSLVSTAPPPSSNITDATSFVRHTPHIHVSISYRVGLLGFLRTPASPNPGFLDQCVALSWVSRNISSFGGDPRQVTLMGESAGAACVHYHLLSRSRGFRRAILMSGSAFTIPPQPRATCDALTQRVAARLSTTVDGLATVAVDDLLKAQAELGLHALFPSDELLPVGVGAELDGPLPDHVHAVLIGDCKDEHNLWRKSLVNPSTPPVWPDTPGSAAVRMAYGDDGRAAMELIADSKFNFWAHNLWKNDGRVWRYALDAANPFDSHSPLGAHHAVDLVYLFGGDELGKGKEVGEDMKGVWGRFVSGERPWGKEEVGEEGRRAFGGTGERREEQWKVLEMLGWRAVDEVVRVVGRGRIGFDPGC